ncbi:hypothetical protein ACFQH8_07320 [Halomicroarcula sp. GCM10025710]
MRPLDLVRVRVLLARGLPILDGVVHRVGDHDDAHYRSEDEEDLEDTVEHVRRRPDVPSVERKRRDVW